MNYKQESVNDESQTYHTMCCSLTTCLSHINLKTSGKWQCHEHQACNPSVRKLIFEPYVKVRCFWYCNTLTCTSKLKPCYSLSTTNICKNNKLAQFTVYLTLLNASFFGTF